MKKWRARLHDCLCLNFAIEAEEVKRLLPRGTEVDYRRFRGKKRGFFSIFFFDCDSFQHSTVGWPSFNFPAAILQFYIRDAYDNPSTYLGRIYSPGFVGSLGRWILNLPVRKLSFSYPTRANPGGKFRWMVEGAGAGNVQCKIENQSGIKNHLGEMFDTSRQLRNFLFQRTYCYFGAGTKNVHRLKPGIYFENIHPVDIKDWELGFTASDLERHSFPEARSNCFYLPELKLDLKGPNSVPVKELTG